MRILYLATDLFFKGGIQRYGRYQIRALREEPKVEDVIVCSLWNEHQEHAFEEAFPVHYAGTGVSLRSKLAFAWRAITWARSQDIDLVMCNHVALAPIAYVIRLLWGIPYTVNAYGLEIWNGINLLEARSLATANTIIGDCRFILEYIGKHFTVAASRLALLYDCVDLDVFGPRPAPAALKAKYGIPEGKTLAMTIGRLVYDKGQVTMIRTVKHLPEDIAYVIVGGGTEREHWERLAIEEGVKDRVIFTGRVPEEELVQMYNLCDLFVYLSEFKPHEGGGLPLVSIEAAACAKPVLTSDQDGAREAVANGVTGFIVPPRDIEQIAGRVTQICGDADLRARMGEAALAYVRNHFSYQVFRETSSAILANFS